MHGDAIRASRRLRWPPGDILSAVDPLETGSPPVARVGVAEPGGNHVAHVVDAAAMKTPLSTLRRFAAKMSLLILLPNPLPFPADFPQSGLNMESLERLVAIRSVSIRSGIDSSGPSDPASLGPRAVDLDSAHRRAVLRSAPQWPAARRMIRTDSRAFDFNARSGPAPALAPQAPRPPSHA